MGLGTDHRLSLAQNPVLLAGQIAILLASCNRDVARLRKRRQVAALVGLEVPQALPRFPATTASSDYCSRLRAPACAPFGFGLRRRFPSSSALRCILARPPKSLLNFQGASSGSTPSAPYVLCRSQTHDIGFIQSERLASGSRPSRGFDSRFTCVGTHVFVR